MNKTKTDPSTSALRLFARRFVRVACRLLDGTLDSLDWLGAAILSLIELIFFPPQTKPKITVPHITLGTFISSDNPPAPCYLPFEALNTHLHGRGLTRTGKSKLIEHICCDLLREKQGFTLIDPNGELFWKVGAQLASRGIPAYLMNP